jgi:hypothetical protein
MRYADKNNNSKEKSRKNTRTNFSKEFAIRFDEVEKLTEKAYLG